MDALTAQPSRTFKRWVNNPANPTSGIVVPVTFTIRGDLQKAESLLYMAPGVLQKMRYENAQHLPDYRKTVTVGGEGGRWEATIVSQTQFGMESVTIYVPPLPPIGQPKEKTDYLVMYVPAFEALNIDGDIMGYVISYGRWGESYEYIPLSQLLTTLHDFYDENYWYYNGGVDPFLPGEPKEVLIHTRYTGTTNKSEVRSIYNVPCKAEKLLYYSYEYTGGPVSFWDGGYQVYWCDLCPTKMGAFAIYTGHIDDNYAVPQYLNYCDDYTVYDTGTGGIAMLASSGYPRYHGSGWWENRSWAGISPCTPANIAWLEAYTETAGWETPNPAFPVPLLGTWVDAVITYDDTGAYVTHDDSAASYEEIYRGCHLWSGVYPGNTQSTTYALTCDAARYPLIYNKVIGATTYNYRFEEYFTVNGQDHLTLGVSGSDYTDYDPAEVNVRWYQLSDSVNGSIIALGALRRPDGGDTNKRYEYFYCSDNGERQSFNTQWFTDIASGLHVIPNVIDENNNLLYGGAEFRLFRIVTETKEIIAANNT